MSVVTGITLHTKHMDYVNVAQINRWLEVHEFGPLIHVSGYYGGTKHPQVSVWGAGYNYFSCEEEFVEYVQSLSWNYAENTVLIINPEEGGARVIRL